MTDDIRKALREGGTDYITLPSRDRSKKAVTSNTRGKWPTVNGVVEVPYVIEQSSREYHIQCNTQRILHGGVNLSSLSSSSVFQAAK